MPIKPENKSRYPSNWKEIRQRILDRAENRCEVCKVLNRTRIARGTGDDSDTYMTADAEVYCADTGTYLGQTHMSSYQVARMTDIVLTIAHLDHTPENCAEDNLQAMCQRCHLKYDAEHHKANSAITRKSKKAVADLFS